MDGLILVCQTGRAAVDRKQAAVTTPAKYILQAERLCAFETPGENISFRQGQAQCVNAVVGAH